MLQNFEFLNPQFLWLLILIPILAVWYFLIRKSDTATLTIASTKGFETNPSMLAKLKPLLYVLRLLALTLLIVALARPRNVSVSKRTKTNKGIDIVMAIDVPARIVGSRFKAKPFRSTKNCGY